jgi:hypothetical protein
MCDFSRFYLAEAPMQGEAAAALTSEAAEAPELDVSPQANWIFPSLAEAAEGAERSFTVNASISNSAAANML